jgi:pimeloyl-ACP methyl ester carboxylesterase
MENPILEFNNKADSILPLINSFNLLPLPPEKRIRNKLSFAFTPQYFNTHIEEINQIVEWRLQNPQPFYAWKRQFRAGIKFDATSEIHRINVPTLVIAGSDDRVVSPESSKRLSEGIPNSRFKIIEETGHLLFIEKAEEFNRTVLDFLKEISKTEKPIEQEEEKVWWKKIPCFLSSLLKRFLP